MAAKDYFNRIHRKIVQNTGASSSLRNQSELNSFLNRTREDIANLTDYINNIVYPIFQGPGMDSSKESILCWGPKWEFDAVLDGLAATTLQTFAEEHGGGPFAPECYWFDDGLGGGRPRTIKETFDCLLAMISDQKVLIQEKDVDLSDILEKLECLARNDQRIIKDSFGCNYDLTCTDSHTLDWPIGKHIYEIFRQVIVGHGGLSELGMQDPDSGVCSGVSYPELTIQVPQSKIIPDICIDPSLICSICAPDDWDGETIVDDIQNILQYIGSEVCDSTPDFSSLAGTCLSAIVDKSLTEAITIIAEEVCNKCEAAYDEIELSADGGTLNPSGGDDLLVAESCAQTLRFTAGPNITLEGSNSNGGTDIIKISADQPDGILGNLNDAYHFETNPPYGLGIIALEEEYENTNLYNNSWTAECIPRPGAGLYLMDDSPDLKSKLFAIVGDFRTGGGGLGEGHNGPPAAYFSVGTHWGIGKLDEHVNSGFMTPEEAAPFYLKWQRKIVHTEDSIFYMQKLINTSVDNIFTTFLPQTAGFNDSGDINPETGNSDIIPPHNVTCPPEGAVWVSDGLDPSLLVPDVLDACGNALQKNHLYYRMPGDGAVWKLSSCGAGNLQDSYDHDKDGDGNHDGGRIKLRPDAQQRGLWLQQDADFITPGNLQDYWPTPFFNDSGSPVDPYCPYYIPWFAITDENNASNPDGAWPFGPVGTTDAIKTSPIIDRFFSVQYRDQCILTLQEDDCCCKIDEFGQLTDPSYEFLYPIGGVFNMGAPAPCDLLPCFANNLNAFGWFDVSGMNEPGVKTFSYGPGDCFAMPFPIPGDPSPGFAALCIEVLTEDGRLDFEVDYDCSCTVGTTTWGMVEGTEGPGAYGADIKIDTDCFYCCYDHDDLTANWLYPLGQVNNNPALPGSSGFVNNTEAEDMDSLSYMDGMMVDRFLEPANTGACGCWDPALVGNEFGVLGLCIDPATGIPYGGTIQDQKLLVHEDTLAAASMTPGQSISYNVDDCVYLYFEVTDPRSGAIYDYWLAYKCLTAHSVYVGECYWTNDWITDAGNPAGGLAPLIDDYGSGVAYPGGDKFYPLIGPDLNNGQHWEPLPWPCTWWWPQGPQLQQMIPIDGNQRFGAKSSQSEIDERRKSQLKHKDDYAKAHEAFAKHTKSFMEWTMQYAVEYLRDPNSADLATMQQHIDKDIDSITRLLSVSFTAADSARVDGNILARCCPDSEILDELIASYQEGAEDTRAELEYFLENLAGTQELLSVYQGEPDPSDETLLAIAECQGKIWIYQQYILLLEPLISLLVENKYNTELARAYCQSDNIFPGNGLFDLDYLDVFKGPVGESSVDLNAAYRSTLEGASQKTAKAFLVNSSETEEVARKASIDARTFYSEFFSRIGLDTINAASKVLRATSPKDRSTIARYLAMAHVKAKEADSLHSNYGSQSTRISAFSGSGGTGQAKLGGETPFEDCDILVRMESVQHPSNPQLGVVNIWYQAGGTGRNICAITLATNDLGINLLGPNMGQTPQDALVAGAMLTSSWDVNGGTDLVGIPLLDRWGGGCVPPGDPTFITPIEDFSNGLDPNLWGINTYLDGNNNPTGEVRTQALPILGVDNPGPESAFVFCWGETNLQPERYLIANNNFQGVTKLDFLYTHGMFELGTTNPGMDMDLPEVNNAEHLYVQYKALNQVNWVNAETYTADVNEEGDAAGWSEGSVTISDPGGPYQIRFVQTTYNETVDHWAVTNIQFSKLSNPTFPTCLTPPVNEELLATFTVASPNGVVSSGNIPIVDCQVFIPDPEYVEPEEICSYMDPGIAVYCCGDPNIDGEDPNNYAHAYFSVKVNYAAEFNTLFEFYYNAPSYASVPGMPDFAKEGLSSFSFILDTSNLIDVNGDPLCLQIDPANPSADFGFVSAAMDNNFTVHAIPVQNDPTKILIDARMTDTCLPQTDSAKYPCDPEYVDNELLLVYRHGTGYDLANQNQPDCHVPIDENQSVGPPLLEDCQACACPIPAAPCFEGRCCALDEPSPSIPDPCTPWPSVHFWQSPAYFTCLPKGWAPNTCDNEGVIWVGGTPSDENQNGFGSDCTIYYREPSNGTIHDLTLGAGGSANQQKFIKFSADAYNQSNGEGVIWPGPISYTSGNNDMFKLYAMTGIAFVTEDSPVLPGGENAIGIGLDFGNLFPGMIASRMAPAHFQYKLASNSGDFIDEACVTEKTVLAPSLMHLMDPDKYSEHSAWRNLHLYQRGASTAVEMVFYEEEYKGQANSASLNFRKLRGITDSSTDQPLSIMVGQYEDAVIVFNPSVIPISALKDVSTAGRKDGDYLVYSSEADKFLPSSIKQPDLLCLASRENFPEEDEMGLCTRGTIVYIDNSQQIASGFYVYDGSSWVQWLAF